MSIFDSGLATKGMNALVRFRILKRHLYSFLRHLTGRKLVNFVKAEVNRIRRKDVLDSYPYILKIEPSNICNLRCAFCYDDRRQPLEGERAYGRMTSDQFKHLIDEVGPYLFKINLYGFGEPWLFPETFQMIRHATDKNIGVGVSSNMNVKDPDLAAKILDSGLEVLIFSAHGATQQAYGRFMRGGDMALAFENLARLVAERARRRSSLPFIDWQYCVTGFNEAEIPLAERKARELGVDQIRFIKPFFPQDAPDEWWSSMFPKNTFGHEQEPPPGCSWPYRSAYVSWDGGILPCCREFRPTANDLGNAFTDGFLTAWNNARYQASRRRIADPSAPCDTICARCPVTQRRG